MKKQKKFFVSIIVSIITVFNLNVVYGSTITTDINSLDDAKYPGIKNQVQNLQHNHPNWKFQFEFTGIDFQTAVINECQGHCKSPRNLVPANDSRYSGKWICPVCGTKLYDSQNWYCASEDAVKYMLDPRNSINESDIFQFLDLSDVADATSEISTSNTDIKISDSNIEVVPNVNFDTIKTKYADAVITDKNNNAVTSGNIGTGCKITTNNKTYTVIKKGDVTGEGNVDIIDVVNILNFITEKKEFNEIEKSASKVFGTGETNIIDVVNILNHITEKKNITISENSSNSNMNTGVQNLASSLSYLDADCINAILKAGNEYKINPLYLVARIYQEQGNNGSTLISGQGYEGQYAGVYNFFNINACGNGQAAIIKNGLSYAQSKGWTSKPVAILGGANVIANSYINKKQNTLYYQKFNVVGTNPLYSHQYMQNILAAQNEGTSLRKTYASIDSNFENCYTFTIPIYENMPQAVSSRPATSGFEPANYELKTISVNSSVFVRAGASTSAQKITSLSNGLKVKVLSTTPEKIDGYNWSLVVCEETGAYGYVASNYIK